MAKNPSLPENPVRLELFVSFPRASFPLIKAGYEAQYPEDRWDIAFREPWVQISRSQTNGLFCYAVRFEECNSDRIRVAEAWAGQAILQWFGDLTWHTENVVWLLTTLAQHPSFEVLSSEFDTGLIRGKRGKEEVTFSGTAKTATDVEKIAEKLLAEVILLNQTGNTISDAPV